MDFVVCWAGAPIGFLFCDGAPLSFGRARLIEWDFRTDARILRSGGGSVYTGHLGCYRGEVRGGTAGRRGRELDNLGGGRGSVLIIVADAC